MSGLHNWRCDYAVKPLEVPEAEWECYCPSAEDLAARLPCGHSPEEEPAYQCAEWQG